MENNLDDEKRFYIGITEHLFKKRFCNHKKSFNLKKYEKETELSKYIWKPKEDSKSPSIKWSIIKRVNSTPNKSFCKLFLMEKLFIIKSLDDNDMLNKRSELIYKCRHQNKTLLCNFKNNLND